MRDCGADGTEGQRHTPEVSQITLVSDAPHGPFRVDQTTAVSVRARQSTQRHEASDASDEMQRLHCTVHECADKNAKATRMTRTDDVGAMSVTEMSI